MAGARVRYIAGKVVRGCRAALISNPWKRKAFYLSHDYPGEIAVNRETISFNLLGLTLQTGFFELVLDSYPMIRALHASKSAKFYLEKNKLLVSIDGIVVSPATAEEFFILNEIFVRGTYNFDFPESCVVVDVGMNVGLASLFFASFQQVERVFAFEPFQPTFMQASANFSGNHLLQGKIVSENYGLGAADETLEVDYDYSNKGQAGIYGTGLIRSRVLKAERQAIVIKDAAGVLTRIFDAYPDKPIVLKLDCEGSEYAIMERLSVANHLSRFRLILIEWHERGPAVLLALLRESGFVSFYQQSAPNVGMIYAIRYS